MAEVFHCDGKAIMKTDRLLFMKELLTEQMDHWFLFPIALFFMGFVREPEENPSVMLWILLSTVPLLFYALRREVKKFSFLLLVHIAASMLFILTFTQMFFDDRVLCIVCVTGYALYSFFQKVIGSQPYTKTMQLPWGVGISAAVMLIQRSDRWISYYCFALTASLALFFILYYMEHYLEFLSVNKSSTGYIPASEMFRSGLGLVIGYSLLGAAIMMISTHFHWTLGFLHTLKTMLKEFLHNLFSDFFREEAPEALHPNMGAADLPSTETLPVSEPFRIWEILWQVVEFAFAAALLFAAVKLLVRFIRWLERFMNRTHSEDFEGDEALDIREKCDLDGRSAKKQKDFSEVFSYRERIRRLYKRKVMAFAAGTEERTQGRLGYYTAREWERKMREENCAKKDGMAVIYEQARYSEREMTAEDLKKMKNACKM